GELRVLGVGAHHVPGAGCLWRTARELAVNDVAGNKTGELLALDDAVGVALAKSVDGGKRHGGGGEAAAPGGGGLKALFEFDPPAGITLLGLEELSLLCPLRDRIGAAEVLAGLGLVLSPRLGVLDEVLAHHKQQVIAVVDHHVELIVVVLLILEAM